VRLHDIDEVERQLFRSCFSTLGDGGRVSKVGGLQSVNSYARHERFTALIKPVLTFALSAARRLRSSSFSLAQPPHMAHVEYRLSDYTYKFFAKL